MSIRYTRHIEPTSNRENSMERRKVSVRLCRMGLLRATISNPAFPWKRHHQKVAAYLRFTPKKSGVWVQEHCKTSGFRQSPFPMQICICICICKPMAPVGLSGPPRLRVQSRSRTQWRIVASIAFFFCACFKRVLDTIAPQSRLSFLGGLEQGGLDLPPVFGCEIGMAPPTCTCCI